MIVKVTSLQPDPGPYPAGRRCMHEQDGVRCITILSRYRPGPWCCQHEHLHPDEPGHLTIEDLAA